MENKSILFVSQYFTPEVFRGNDIAYDWAKRGVKVTVLTGIPNYPAGRFFDGYGIFRRHRECVDGVNVIRIPIFPRGKSAVTLLLNYLSYGINASVYLFSHLFRHKYDACFVQQLSPVNMVQPGLLFKKLTSKPLYTWVLDLWPESLKYAGHIDNSFVLGFFDRIVRKEYKLSDRILISSKGFEKSILSKGEYSHKIEYFPNWAEDVFSEAMSVSLPKLPVGFIVMFAGNVGEAQDFESIVKAAELLSEEDDIKFVIVGDGRKKAWLDEQIATRHLEDRIFALGRYPIETMPSFFKVADVMLVSLKDDEMFRLTAPAKIQAYMCSSKPIAGMISGEGNALIHEADCGIAVPSGAYTELVVELRRLRNLPNEELKKLGRNGKKFCSAHFDKWVLMERLYNMVSGQNSL